MRCHVFCWSLLKDGWKCVSGKQCYWNRPAGLPGRDWQETSLDGLNLIYQRSSLVINLIDTNTLSCKSLKINQTWGVWIVLSKLIVKEKKYKSESQFISSFISEICLLSAVICEKIPAARSSIIRKPFRNHRRDYISQHSVVAWCICLCHGSKCLGPRLGR